MFSDGNFLKAWGGISSLQVNIVEIVKEFWLAKFNHEWYVKAAHKFTTDNYSLHFMQFVLPVTWSYGRKYGMTIEQLALWWSERPAKLAGLTSKVNSCNTPIKMQNLCYVYIVWLLLLVIWNGAKMQMQGGIVSGNRADIVVWNSDTEFHLNDDHPVFIKHPVRKFKFPIPVCIGALLIWYTYIFLCLL